MTGSIPFGALGGAVVKRLRRFQSDRRGGIAAVVAVISPVLVGSMGLGGEAGYWYLTQRNVQNAADVAAHAAALRANNGETLIDLQPVAEYLVGQAGVTVDTAVVGLASPPTTGQYIEDGAAVEVTVTQTVPRLFSAMYSSEPVEISARAVATARAGGTGCVLALNTDTLAGLQISGSSNVNLILCDLISNAAGSQSLNMNGSGFVSANCVQTTGTASVTANLTLTCAERRENAAPVADPYGDRVEPAITGTCQDGDVGQNGQSTTVVPLDAHTSGLSAIRYCNGLNLRGSVFLSPGLYIIEGGDFRLNANTTVFGAGVMFYLADGVEMHWNGTAQVTLSPPTAGDYQGMLIFGSRSTAEAESHTINGNFGSILDGAIYTPESHLELSGNTQTSFTGCTHVVGDTITFSGNSIMSIHCLFPQTTTIEIAGAVTVVE